MTKDTFLATFHNIRPVHGRKQVQFIFEVPMEKANAALQILGGIPNPEVSVWAGIVRLTDEAAERALESPQKPTDEPEPTKARTPFKGLTASQQAGIACHDPTFQKWIGVDEAPLGTREAYIEAGDLLRRKLDIPSRSKLREEPAKTKEWDALYARFQQETGRVAERHG